MPLALVAVSLLAALFALVGGFHEAALAAGPARLGTAGNFAVLASSTITNTGPTTITGDVGLYPGSSVTGFAPCPAPDACVDLTGELYVSDAEGVALLAQAAALSAYTTLAQSTCTELVNVELAGQTFTPGVYCSPGTFNLSAAGILTLDAQGDPDAEFIFLTGAGGTTLITGADSQVLLTGAAQPCNVYWQVGSSATIGVGTDFVGNILAEDSIQLQTGATLEGRALALNGAVTLDTNTITRADCEDSPTTTPPTTSTPTTVTPTTVTPTTVTPTTSTPTTSTPTTSAGSSTTGSIPGATTSGSGTTGGGSSTSTARTTTTSLARTGSALTTTLALGLLAIILGAGMLLGSRRIANGVAGRQLHRR